MSIISIYSYKIQSLIFKINIHIKHMIVPNYTAKIYEYKQIYSVVL